MKHLAWVTVILLTGCAAANTHTGGARLTRLEEETRIVAERENQCVGEALMRNRDQMARIAATPGASAEAQVQMENQVLDAELSECRARADRDSAKLTAHERDEYELEAKQERDRATLMTILTTSGPR
jgi:hypothetical protein